jgi:hypothetical protein
MSDTPATVVQQAPTRRPDSVEVWPTLFDYADTPEVRAAMEARHAFGVAKYGQPLVTFDGRDTKTDLLQELLDVMVYERKLQLEQRAPIMPMPTELMELLNSRVAELLGNIAADRRAERIRDYSDERHDDLGDRDG